MKNTMKHISNLTELSEVAVHCASCYVTTAHMHIVMLILKGYIVQPDNQSTDSLIKHDGCAVFLTKTDSSIQM